MFQKDLETQTAQASGAGVQVNMDHIQGHLNRSFAKEGMYHSVENLCPKGEPNMQAALSERIRSKLGSFMNFPMSMKTKLKDQHDLHFVGGVCALPTLRMVWRV